MTNVAPLYFHDSRASPASASVLASIFGLVNLVARRSAGSPPSAGRTRRRGCAGGSGRLALQQSIEGACCVMPRSRWGWRRRLTTPAVGGHDRRVDERVGRVVGERHRRRLRDDRRHVGASEVLLTDAHRASRRGDLQAALRRRHHPRALAVRRRRRVVPRTGHRRRRRPRRLPLLRCRPDGGGPVSFGVVPYVSRPALGVVNGMVGAGGNLGAVITLSAFFPGPGCVDVGRAGKITIIGVTLPFFVYSLANRARRHARRRARSASRRCKEPARGYRGADAMALQQRQPREHEERRASKARTKGGSRRRRRRSSRRQRAQAARETPPAASERLVLVIFESARRAQPAPPLSPRAWTIERRKCVDTGHAVARGGAVALGARPPSLFLRGPARL